MIFSNLSSRQQYLLNVIKKFRQNGQLKSRNLSEEKNPSRAQIFRHFRIEIRNKNETKKVNILHL